MEKYLGNKTTLLPLLSTYILSRVPSGTSISDPFTGTTNVARFFRARGWSALVSDINRFSHTLANTYIGRQGDLSFDGLPQSYQRFPISLLKSKFDDSALRTSLLATPPEDLWRQLRSGASILAVLQKKGSENREPGAIYNHFTVFGRHSAFKSIRGRSGKRNYFSESNALILDGILGTVRHWWRHGDLSRDELDFLMTSIIEETVITANVSGTFHDFNRERLWPNSLQPFTLRVPLSERASTEASIVNSDALDAAAEFTKHDVCYIDPPYNFRQYTAYYHFLNFIAAYPHLPSVEAYLSRLEHVRGQNMEDDYASSFSCKTSFIETLRKLITMVPANHIFLSYYGGRNHWNHWADVETLGGEGFDKISAVFEDTDLFSKYEVTSALDIRKNFQSRVGERKSLVQEHLFYGEKRSNIARPRASKLFTVNARLGLGEAFRPIIKIRSSRKGADERRVLPRFVSITDQRAREV